jgi:hypothetical protein
VRITMKAHRATYRAMLTIAALMSLHAPHAAYALINDRGQLIDSTRNLELARCERLAQQAVASGFRKIASPASRLTLAERRAGWAGDDDVLLKRGIARVCRKDGGGCAWIAPR